MAKDSKNIFWLKNLGSTAEKDQLLLYSETVVSGLDLSNSSFCKLLTLHDEFIKF